MTVGSPTDALAKKALMTRMGGGHYIVVENASGWTVREGDSAIADAASRDEALITAKLLAFAVKAVGGQASVFVQDKTGLLEPYKLEGG